MLKNKPYLVVLLSMFLLGQMLMSKSYVQAATLTDGSATLSDSRVSQTGVSYTLEFGNVTTSAIKCMKVVFSDATSGGSVPTGLSTASADIAGTSDYIPTPGSWTVDGSSTNGTVQITYATGETPASSSGRTLTLTGITNGSTAETGYYVQFNTYTAEACTGAVDDSVLAFIYTNGQVVSATVDPSLSFSISAVSSGGTVNGATTNVSTTTSTVPFATVSPSTNVVAAHDLSIGTNASNGYTVFTRYTQELQNGSADVIDDHTGTNATPTVFPSGTTTEAFGYTTDDATLGTGTAGRFISNKWAAFTTSDVELAYSATPTSDTVRVGYQVSVADTTPAGAYQTTVIYSAVPTY